jgi:hypothetical protein
MSGCLSKPVTCRGIRLRIGRDDHNRPHLRTPGTSTNVRGELSALWWVKVCPPSFRSPLPSLLFFRARALPGSSGLWRHLAQTWNLTRPGRKEWER